ncbi:MAG: hypothetical protein HGA39_04915 [Coriobacteriia bacterium]|nr:hypothetical protein [Coriobacteriia bacterium]
MGLLTEVSGMLIVPLWGIAWWQYAVTIFSALVLLDTFDIPLPRGDSISVGGALCAAGLIVLGPLGAISACFVAMVLAVVIRWKKRRHDGIVGRFIARAAAITASLIVLAPLSAWQADWAGLASAILVPAVFLSVELVTGQIVSAEKSGRGFGRLLTGNLRTQAPLLIAQWSGAVLFLLIYQGMGPWSVIPVVALLLLMRQSYTLLLDIRETYRTTVEVLVEAAESQDERRLGHAERTAAVARAIGGSLGLSASQLEAVSYAALLHDIDAISADAGHHACDEQGSPNLRRGKSSEVIRGVEFFADVLPILEVCDGNPSRDVTESQKLAALVVAIASDADAAEDEGVWAAHSAPAVDVVAPIISAQGKAQVVGAALALGFKVPAIR